MIPYPHWINKGAVIIRKAKLYKTRTIDEQYEIVTWHAWGQTANEDGMDYPAAVVEDKDGKVLVVDADQIQFLTPTALDK